MMRRADPFENILMLVKIEGRTRRGWQRKRWLDDNPTMVGMSLSKLSVMVMESEASTSWGCKMFDMTEQLN